MESARLASDRRPGERFSFLPEPIAQPFPVRWGPDYRVTRAHVVMALMLITFAGWYLPDFAVALVPVSAAVVLVSYLVMRRRRRLADQSRDGILFVGKNLGEGRDKDIWLTREECLRHFLVTGCTGSGRREYLLSVARNALQIGSGFLMVDGQGDLALYHQVYALCREQGREDDLLVLNFLDPESAVASPNAFRSHRVNPFERGTAAALVEMIVSLIEVDGADGKVWRGRAESLLTGLLRALVWKRDVVAGDFPLDVAGVLSRLDLASLFDLADEEKEPDMPPKIRAALMGYLAALPGYHCEKGPQQGQAAKDQHATIKRLVTKVLGGMSDAYEYVFVTPHGDVTMEDVVANRRILLVMLPGLDKSPAEVAALGKIIVAMLKGMVAARAEGQADPQSDSPLDFQYLARQPEPELDAKPPFFCIFDSAFHYGLDDIGNLCWPATQQGLVLVFSDYDILSLQRAGRAAADDLLKQIGNFVGLRQEADHIFFRADETRNFRHDLAEQKLPVGHAVFRNYRTSCTVRLPYWRPPSQSQAKVNRLVSYSPTRI